eukprot:1155496-Pelagomonas_calceolata.AAC.2
MSDMSETKETEEEEEEEEGEKEEQEEEEEEGKRLPGRHQHSPMLINLWAHACMIINKNSNVFPI